MSVEGGIQNIAGSLATASFDSKKMGKKTKSKKYLRLCKWGQCGPQEGTRGHPLWHQMRHQETTYTVFTALSCDLRPSAADGTKIN